MNNIRIRKLKPADMGKIGDLLRTREELDDEGVNKRKRLLEWLAFKNPFAKGDSTYFIAEDRGKIVGHFGRMPTEFVIRGKIGRGYFFHELYVHPEYRKKGKGFFLSMALSNMIEKKSESFCCAVWTSPFTLEMQRRRGYHELRATKYMKVLNPLPILEKRIKQKYLAQFLSQIVRRILFLADFILLKLTLSDINVSTINRFDSRFDDLNQQVFHKLGISSFKSSSYLNWKFGDRPFKNVEVFAAEKNGYITGFVVIASSHKKKYPEGVIVDIMADPDDRSTISALLRTAVDHFRQTKVHLIKCCLTDKRFVKTFKRFLFLKGLTKEPVMLTNLEKYERKEYLIDINNWHLTYGESDEFMLRP